MRPNAYALAIGHILAGKRKEEEAEQEHKGERGGYAKKYTLPRTG